MRIVLFFALCLFFLSASAQNNQPPCSLPEASQFDFWLGDWNLTYNDTLHATNHIEKIMGGCTVQENFNDPNMHYSGKSWSVYSKNYKMWQQTWVDNETFPTVNKHAGHTGTFPFFQNNTAIKY